MGSACTSSQQGVILCLSRSGHRLQSIPSRCSADVSTLQAIAQPHAVRLQQLEALAGPVQTTHLPNRADPGRGCLQHFSVEHTQGGSQRCVRLCICLKATQTTTAGCIKLCSVSATADIQVHCSAMTGSAAAGGCCGPSANQQDPQLWLQLISGALGMGLQTSPQIRKLLQLMQALSRGHMHS